MAAPPPEVAQENGPTVLDALPLFASLSEPTRRRLTAAGVEQTFRAGTTLFSAGTEAAGIYIVLSGRIRVIRSRQGRQHVVHSEGPGGTLAEVPFFEGGLLPATAIASRLSCCLVLNREDLRAVMRDDPAVAWLFLRRLSARIRHLVERLDRASSQTVPGRLAAFIMMRAAATQSHSFTLGVTQAELAEELGTVREVVVRALARLRDAGLITFVGRGRYAVKNRAALAELAAS